MVLRAAVPNDDSEHSFYNIEEYYNINNALSWQGFQVNTQNDEKEGVM
jgi:hypothetical protein